LPPDAPEGFVSLDDMAEGDLPPGGKRAGGAKAGAGKSVNVRGYYRRNGEYIRAHMRAAAARGGGGRGGR